MEIKIVLIVTLICSLISVSSGLKATYNSQFPPSQKCPEMKDFGKFYAAISPKSDYTCGNTIMIQCGGQPYCKDPDNLVKVKIVDRCIPESCPGKDDMILSKAAFDELANTTEPVIDIEIYL
ncbi:hypothetical protein AgCh_002922 [Apium graveolens]